jgi:molybdopterin converting factor subunit 1
MFCESKGKAKGGRLAYPVWMRVTVLYFGVLKDVMGQRSAVMDVAEGASVAELLALHRGSGAASVWDSIAVAVNQEYARVEDVLKDGDEVALLPPVSGGSYFAMDDEVAWIGRHTPGAKAPRFNAGLKAKAEALAYLEAKARAETLWPVKCL